jgi:hypothetical protein
MLHASLNLQTRRKRLKQYEIFDVQHIASLNPKLLNLSRKRTSCIAVNYIIPLKGSKAIGPRADLRVLPKETGRMIRVKNFSLFEGAARV